VCRTRTGCRSAGFGLIEIVVALAIVAVLATVALPSLQEQIRRTRRADAIAAVIRVQQAQERYRASQPIYAASLGSGGLGLPTSSPSGHYLLSSSAASGAEGNSYTVQAQAQGAQADDAGCRYLVLRVDGGQIVHASGPDTSAANLPIANKACWGQ
jgi:type IV pilus assembly protein PilE